MESQNACVAVGSVMNPGQPDDCAAGGAVVVDVVVGATVVDAVGGGATVVEVVGLAVEFFTQETTPLLVLLLDQPIVPVEQPTDID
jgi:hypothetical protein